MKLLLEKEFSYSVNDMISYNKAISECIPKNNTQKVYNNVLSIYPLIVVGLAIYIDILVIKIGIIFGSLLLMMLPLFSNQKFQIKNYYIERYGNPEFMEKRKLYIYEDSIIVETKFDNNRTSMTSIDKIIEKADLIIIEDKKKDWLILPKRYFDSADIELIRNLIDRK